MSPIRSRENPRVKRWTKLASQRAFRRSEQALLLEGPHLVGEALGAGLEPIALIVSEPALEHAEVIRLIGTRRPVVLAERVFRAMVEAETPLGIAAEVPMPRPQADASKHAVFLQGVQDPSNVGAILRTAAAFGVGEVVLDPACADAWSPKALRAAQGGHFKLAIRQSADLAQALVQFAGTTVCTVVTEGIALRRARLEGRLGWIFGAEGRGVSGAIARNAALRVTIPMAPGTESINVAAAAAICLYEAYLRT
jgi:TrmH family RNA methyltransferase